MNFVKATLNVIDRDSASQILSKMEPSEVLELCEDVEITDLCDNKQVWMNLLKAHYPDFPQTKTPKLQYQMLTQGRSTLYYVGEKCLDIPSPQGPATFCAYQGKIFPKFRKEALRIFEQDDYVDAIEDLEIYGAPLPSGTELWHFAVGLYGESKTYSQGTFTTFDDALEYAVEHFEKSKWTMSSNIKSTHFWDANGEMTLDEFMDKAGVVEDTESFIRVMRSQNYYAPVNPVPSDDHGNNELTPMFTYVITPLTVA